uniref:pentapeptide repeat-containing protein n=1 Tax=Streptomyces polyasparticus TaxID=2767826 RepID=UPI0034D67B5C
MPVRSTDLRSTDLRSTDLRSTDLRSTDLRQNALHRTRGKANGTCPTARPVTFGRDARMTLVVPARSSTGRENRH